MSLPEKRKPRAKVVRASTPQAHPAQHETKPPNNRSKLSQYVLSLGQKELAVAIKNNKITFVDADAGTGKTFGTMYTYAAMFLSDPVYSILVIRTPSETGDDEVGFLKGELKDKLDPHMQGIKEMLGELMGKDAVDSHMGSRIVFDIPNFQAGRTWDNKLVLIDEAQMISPRIMEMLLTRVGKNTKVVVAGSSRQMFSNGKKARGGLADAIDIFFGEFMDSDYPDIALVELPPDQQMRDSVVSSVTDAYSKRHP